MTLPKQKKDESDADYAARLEKIKESRKEYLRKWREANRDYWRKWQETHKEHRREYRRKYREGNREALTEKDRRRREVKAFASAKGKPLQANFARAKRPKILSNLILKVAEDFCRNHGFPLESKWDPDILRHAAEKIRNSPELYDAANPWYGTDYLSSGVVSDRYWAHNFRRRRHKRNNA